MDAAFTDLAARLGAARAITADDVLALRGQVYAAPVVTREEAEVLIALDAAADTRAAEWTDFLGDALGDLMVHQQDPTGYVDDSAADWLIKVLTAAGRLRRDGAVDALARIVDEATELPERLAAFALGKARDAVIAAGAVSAVDIALLRRLVFAGAGEGNLGVTREEAEALFAIDAGCRSGANDPAWPDFFARTIGEHLTAASPYRPESRDDALRDEAWLAGPQTFGSFVQGMVHKPDARGALHEALHPFADQDAEWKDAEASFARDEAAAEPVTDEEWAWVRDRIGPSPSEAAERLLAFLKEGGDAPAETPPAANAAPASAAGAPSGTPVFGHRGRPPVAASAKP